MLIQKIIKYLDLFVHEHLFEYVFILCPDYSLGHVGNQTVHSILINPEYALSSSSESRLVSVEHPNSHINDEEVMVLRVSIEVIRDLLGDEEYLLHVFTLCNQLLSREVFS